MREKGLVEIVNREAKTDTLIAREKYPLIGFVSYLYYFPRHLYDELKTRVMTRQIRKP